MRLTHSLVSRKSQPYPTLTNFSALNSRVGRRERKRQMEEKEKEGGKEEERVERNGKRDRELSISPWDLGKLKR